MPVCRLSMIIAVSLVFSILSACGGGSREFAVILWPPDESPLEYGMVVAVTDSSDIGDTYTVRPLEGEERFTVPKWRAQMFESEELARDFAQEFEPYAESFATANRQALPVREDAERTSRIVYRLRLGEETKVIARSDQPSDEAGFVDYWYEVLTRDGSRGWVFGYNVTGVDGSGAGTGEESILDDPLLSGFLSATWRPTYFSRMLDSGRIDLERFRADYGLFPEPEENRIRLNLEDQSATFEYERWSRGRAGEFIARGTQFSVVVRSENRISVRYTVDGEGYSKAMERLERDIEEVRSEERERREALYESLRSRGSGLVSNAYGSILLRDDGAFEWSRYSRLVPAVIPASAESGGRVRFDHFRSDDISEEYEGALSFRFTGAEDQPAVFLYQFVSGGLRLAHVPPDNIRDKVVVRESRSPLIIFFSFEEGDST